MLFQRSIFLCNSYHYMRSAVKILINLESKNAFSKVSVKAAQEFKIKGFCFKFWVGGQDV